MKYCQKSIRECCTCNAEILRVIYGNMIKTRKKQDIKYRPITENEYMTDIFLPAVDLTKIFTEFNDGDYAFLTYEKEGPFQKEMIHNLYNYSDVEMYFNGEKVKLKQMSDGSLDGNVTFNEGGNNVIVKVTAKADRFQVSVRDYMPEIRIAAQGYVYNTRQYINREGFSGQTDIAISRLYKKQEPVPEISVNAIEWIYPVKPVESNKKSFDFNKRLGYGYTAYAYTHFKGDIVVKHNSPLKVFADGTEIYSALKGESKFSFSKETELLIKSRKDGSEWGFVSVSEGVHILPFAETDDCSDLKWLWIGPFGKAEEPIDHPYPPERNIYFNETYPTVTGEKLYWKFYRDKTSLHQNLTTTFYGQWFYPMMVGMNGLRVLADKLGNNEIYDYYNSGMKLLAEHREYACYERAKRGWSDYLPNSVKLDRLDPIGTIGMNLCEYYLMTADKGAENLILKLSDAMMHAVPRLEDGTFYRIETMWMDDLYMCIPFLARLGVITGERKYFDEIVTQINGFYKRMYMEDQNVFSHIYFPMENVANYIPWGRGNGWGILAMSEALLFIPEDYEGRERILEIYQKFASGILACRDREEGIWHQVINNYDSYIETSGSAMFITALARGVRLGWLDKNYMEDVLAAWNALVEKCIDHEGNIYGVCMGSSCNKAEQYYLNLGTIKNDDHGIGIVIGAGVEIMNLIGE